MIGGDVGGAVVADEGDQVWVQRQVAVLAQLADRHVQPVGGADEHDRVGAQADELADPQPGAQQHFHGPLPSGQRGHPHRQRQSQKPSFGYLTSTVEDGQYAAGRV
jgi:hypothetical protein